MPGFLQALSHTPVFTGSPQQTPGSIGLQKHFLSSKKKKYIGEQNHELKIYWGTKYIGEQNILGNKIYY